MCVCVVVVAAAAAGHLGRAEGRDAGARPIDHGHDPLVKSLFRSMSVTVIGVTSLWSNHRDGHVPSLLILRSSALAPPPLGVDLPPSRQRLQSQGPVSAQGKEGLIPLEGLLRRACRKSCTPGSRTPCTTSPQGWPCCPILARRRPASLPIAAHVALLTQARLRHPIRLAVSPHTHTSHARFTRSSHAPHTLTSHAPHTLLTRSLHTLLTRSPHTLLTRLPLHTHHVAGGKAAPHAMRGCAGAGCSGASWGRTRECLRV
jgi:hypothetical protein